MAINTYACESKVPYGTSPPPPLPPLGVEVPDPCSHLCSAVEQGSSSSQSLNPLSLTLPQISTRQGCEWKNERGGGRCAPVLKGEGGARGGCNAISLWTAHLAGVSWRSGWERVFLHLLRVCVFAGKVGEDHHLAPAHACIPLTHSRLQALCRNAAYVLDRDSRQILDVAHLDLVRLAIPVNKQVVHVAVQSHLNAVHTHRVENLGMYPQ